THELRARPPDDRRGLGRRLLLPGRYGRAAALPRLAHAPARSDEGRQPRPRPRGARLAAARAGTVVCAEARRRLAAVAARGRDGQPARRARGEAQRSRVMTLSLAFDVLLVATIVAVAVWTIAARDAFAAVVGFVAFGLLLALAWVRIAAVDVALTEAAV